MNRAELRRAVLMAALEEVPFEGWGTRTLRRAARARGLEPAAALALFPGGGRAMIELWNALNDEAMIADLRALPLDAMKIRDKITQAVLIRFDRLRPHREAMRRALALLALPGNTGLGLRCLYRTVDSMWFAIGDRSTDSSFYTKRLLLAGVYSATLLVWLDDHSAGETATREFLDRRIAGVMRIPKLRQRAGAWLGRLPNPAALLRPRSPQAGAV